MAQLLKEGELAKDQREQVDIILTCSDHLLVLLNDVLDLSRLEAGALPLELVPVDLRRLMHDVEGMVSPMVQAKRLTLTPRVDPAVPRLVCTDEARIRQILLNLVGNAVKFTNHGEIAVSLDWTAGEMVWRVRDTGIGIPEATLPLLFQPFSQGDASMSRRFGGAGLGLAISQRLAQRLGGAISVTSVVGQGTCFVCRIPTEACPG
jgi:signal transduction histidine kinase